MRKLLIALLSVTILACGEDSVVWPELSEIEHVTGRPASKDDINAGAAVFLLQSEGGEVSAGEPIDMVIPQYAVHLDAESGEKTRVIIIQAEESEGQQLIGALNVLTNEYSIGFYSEYELLGTVTPLE